MSQREEHLSKQMSQLPVSVCILTKNNADTISRTLESVVDWTDEIVIVDSNSQDGTIEICEKYGANVYQHRFSGLPELKRVAMNHAKNEWVLMLDSDEEIPLELRREIFANFPDGSVAYYIKKHEYIMGGWTHQHHLKRPYLAKKDCIYFKQDYVWERLSVRPQYLDRTKTLSNTINHYNSERASDLETKFQQYSSLEAIHTVKMGKQSDPITLLVKGFMIGLHRLTLNKGALDGYRGFFMAFLDFYSRATAYVKIKDIEQLQEEYPNDWERIWLEEECGR